ncbi:MAG: hypothetical protein ACR2NO_11195 [Chloroflexota bacterium]
MGDRLADCLERPFAHLRAEATADPPALMIEVWHGLETEVRCPFSEELALPGPYGVMFASEDGRFIAECRPHSLTVADRHEGRIVAGIPNVDYLYIDEQARPFHRMIAVWLADAYAGGGAAGAGAGSGAGEGDRRGIRDSEVAELGVSERVIS